jgi:hypothetical protein
VNLLQTFEPQIKIRKIYCSTFPKNGKEEAAMQESIHACSNGCYILYYHLYWSAVAMCHIWHWLSI